ncbi:MAG: hypothetical protein ACI94Y_002075 [Maribacter sp.]|jgi:hypothetical protein
MIIKQQSNKLDYRKILPRLVLILLGLLLICGVYYIASGKWKATEITIKTSFENKRGESFYDKGYSFSHNGFQTNALAKTGKHAILVPSDSSQHVAYVEINNPGDLYAHVTVWVKINKGQAKPIINVNSKKEKLFNRSFSDFEEKEGWSEMECWFYAPSNEEIKTLVLDLEVKGKGEIYFDDLKIEFTESFPSYIIPAFKPSEVNLRINDEGMAKLERIRKKAISHLVLVSSDDDWVDAKLEEGDKVLDAKVRLKGDWTDHLKGTKWSYRVKFKKDHTWRRLRTVSFQSPEARNFLYEWILHVLWEKEDVLTTRYDFVTFKVNGEPRGVYAYEEHFEKQLLEYKSRREGPIVRYDESVTWEARERVMKKLYYLPDGSITNNYKYDGAEITPFGESKISKSPTLSRHMTEAHNLLYQSQHQLKTPEEVFDLDLMAKYFAICDLTGAHHASIWHNQRFYYNPVINKLEPIGYDGNVNKQEPNLVFRGQMFFGEPNGKELVDVFYKLSRDTNFIHKYVHYLDEFTQEEYVADFAKKIRKEAILRKDFLKTEFEEAVFETYFMKSRAVKIQGLLQPYNEKTLITYTSPIRKDEVSKTIKIKNKLGLPMVILGTGTTKKNMDFEFDNPDFIWGYTFSKNIQKYNEFDVPANAKYVFGRPIGMDVIVYSKINGIDAPEDHSSSQDIFSNAILDTTAIYNIVGNRIFFEQETKATITKNIIIPEGYTVVFEEGVELDFTNGAAFISKSPVEMQGSEEYPIRLSSSDQSANGFVVMQADGKSIIENVLFTGFDTWKHKNWILTGAVTFYESNVDISNCIITENSCEDALNIIRSNFKINDMTISNTFGDGFDADFCIGEIHDSRFINTGNDGMDFSGSIIDIFDCIVDKGGDKGLSVGEQSKVKAENLTIKNAVLGVASKDLSILQIKNLKLENCQQGFAAFRKKPEYGGGIIYINGYEAENIEILHIIEKGSQLVLNAQKIKG